MRFFKLIAIAMLGLLLIHTPSTLRAEETPLDPNIPAITEGAPTELEDAKYSGPARISYYLSDENFIIVKVDGLKIEEVKGFTLDGSDITDIIRQFQSDGIAEITSREDGFNLTIKVTNDLLPGKHKLGILYGDNELSGTLDSEKLTAEASEIDGRAFGYLRVYGNVSQYQWCDWNLNCWLSASYATVYFWVWDNYYWAYVGATTTDASGNYDVYINGVCGTVYVLAEKNGRYGEGASNVWSCGYNRTYVEINPSIW